MPHALCSSSSGVNGTWTNTPEGISSPTLTDAIFTVASKSGGGWWWGWMDVDGGREPEVGTRYTAVPLEARPLYPGPGRGSGTLGLLRCRWMGWDVIRSALWRYRIGFGVSGIGRSLSCRARARTCGIHQFCGQGCFPWWLQQVTLEYPYGGTHAESVVAWTMEVRRDCAA